MSLGSYNNKKKDYSPVTYSPVRFYNSESKVDPTSMSFSFWKSLLKISIAPYQQNQNEGSYPSIDKDSSIDIYLSPMKAKQLLLCCERFQKNPSEFTNIGVNTNKGIIYLTNGVSEFNTDSTFVVIKIVDPESGNITSAITYEFNKEFYAITDYTGGSNFNKNYDYSTWIEFEMFKTVLKSYVESANCAIAATVIDNNKFDVSRLTSRISSIQEKLGIQFNGGGNSSGGYAKSYFDNNSGSSSSSNTTLNTGTTSESYDEILEDFNLF